MQKEVDLSAYHNAILLSVFTPYISQFAQVRLFGSRVKGCAKTGSDIDLVIVGLKDNRILSQLQAALEESALPVYSTVIAYEDITSKSFLQQIDDTSVPLIEGSID